MFTLRIELSAVRYIVVSRYFCSLFEYPAKDVCQSVSLSVCLSGWASTSSLQPEMAAAMRMHWAFEEP